MPDHMAPTGQPLFRIVDVTRRWGNVEAIKGVSFDVHPGEIILLAGPSGSGKSTLLRVLGGGLKPSSGKIEVNGVDFASMSLREVRKFRSSCGIVEQGSLLVPQLDVHRNVVAGLLSRMPWYQILLSAVVPLEKEKVSALLEQVGLSDRQFEVTANLSGGQQQRVAIARALVSQPSLIIADEPTASLDSRNAVQVTNLMVELVRRTGGTLILCTHWVSLALPFVDRFIGLRDGRVVMDCPARDFTVDDSLDEESLSELYKGSAERL